MSEYEYLEKIGEGGTSEVFKAIQKSLNRTVAIKRIRKEFSQDKTAVERFEREARIISELRHPNITHIYDWRKEGERYCIVMEFIEGKNLQSYLENPEVLVPEIGLGIVLEVTRALEEVHARGIVHRDIKPSNILIDRTGQVKLTDFGIARLVNIKDTLTLTSNGFIVGTPGYMAPEQITGEKITPACDIFSLGIIIYEVISNTHPFKGKILDETIFRILSGSYPLLQSLKHDTPPELEEIVARCLRKRASERYPSVAELTQSLEKYLEENGVTKIKQELKRWVENPPVASSNLSQRMLEIRLQRGKALLSEEKFEEALREFRLASWHVPANEEVKELINLCAIRGTTHLPTVKTQKLALISSKKRPFAISLAIFCLFTGLLLGLFSKLFRGKEGGRGSQVVAPVVELEAKEPKEDIEIKPKVKLTPKLAPIDKNGAKPERVKLRKDRANEKRARPQVVDRSAQQAAKLRIVSQPYAMIFLNGEPFDEAPMGKFKKIKPGEYTLKLFNPKYEEYIEKITLKPGEKRKIGPIILKPLSGVVLVKAPSKTLIWVNGKFQGEILEHKRRYIINLPPGEYRIKLSHSEHGEKQQKVKLKPAETVVINLINND